MNLKEGVPEACYDELVALYSSPGRVYHTMRHLEEAAQCWVDVRRDVGWDIEGYDKACVLQTTKAALLYHDSYYVPGQHRNEEYSSIFAAGAIRRWFVWANEKQVCRLIGLTKLHGTVIEDLQLYEKLFLDCDTAILGAGSDRYDEYARDIAAEYSFLPQNVYRAGRLGFLTKFLKLPHVFHSDYFRDRLERQAQYNLQREFESLS